MSTSQQQRAGPVEVAKPLSTLAWNAWIGKNKTDLRIAVLGLASTNCCSGTLKLQRDDPIRVTIGSETYAIQPSFAPKGRVGYSQEKVAQIQAKALSDLVDRVPTRNHGLRAGAFATNLTVTTFHLQGVLKEAQSSLGLRSEIQAEMHFLLM
jgi:hypothetical protein